MLTTTFKRNPMEPVSGAHIPALDECIAHVVVGNLDSVIRCSTTGIEKHGIHRTLKTPSFIPEADETDLDEVKVQCMTCTIAQINQRYGLPRTPALVDVFNRSLQPMKMACISKLIS